MLPVISGIKQGRFSETNIWQSFLKIRLGTCMKQNRQLDLLGFENLAGLMQHRNYCVYVPY